MSKLVFGRNCFLWTKIARIFVRTVVLCAQKFPTQISCHKKEDTSSIQVSTKLYMDI